MDSSNSRGLLDALSDALAVPEVKAKLVQEVGSRLRLVVGEDNSMVLDLRNDAAGTPAAVAVVGGGPSMEVDATVHLSDADLARVCAGELSPGRAFMTGRLTVRGNLVRAMKCGPIFRLLRTPPPPPRPGPGPGPTVTTSASRPPVSRAGAAPSARL